MQMPGHYFNYAQCSCRQPFQPAAPHAHAVSTQGLPASFCGICRKPSAAETELSTDLFSWTGLYLLLFVQAKL